MAVPPCEQVALEELEIVALGPEPEPMVTVWLKGTQLSASVTFTVYVPAVRLEMPLVVAPLFQL